MFGNHTVIEGVTQPTSCPFKDPSMTWTCLTVANFHQALKSIRGWPNKSRFSRLSTSYEELDGRPAFSRDRAKEKASLRSKM